MAGGTFQAGLVFFQPGNHAFFAVYGFGQPVTDPVQQVAAHLQLDGLVLFGIAVCKNAGWMVRCVRPDLPGFFAGFPWREAERTEAAGKIRVERVDAT